jgi:hypothetical protein
MRDVHFFREALLYLGRLTRINTQNSAEILVVYKAKKSLHQPSCNYFRKYGDEQKDQPIGYVFHRKTPKHRLK